MLDQGWALLVAGLATAVSGVIVALIQQFRKENRQDHAQVSAALERVSNTIDRVEGKVDTHLQWHIKEPKNGRVIRRNKAGSSKATKR